MNDSTAYCLGIDLGTSGVRAIAVDANRLIDPQGNGAIVGEARHSYHLAPPEGDKHEQSPEVWWQTLCNTLDDLFTQIDPKKIRSIAVDGTSGTLLLADEQGTPVTPALMYNDKRSQSEAQRITEVAPTDSAAHGCSSALAKLLHLLANSNARYALHQADWIVGKLTGLFGISDENNCLKLGYDAVNKTWPQWLDDLDVPRTLLPKVYLPGTPIVTISEATQKRFGLSDDVRVIAGTTDSTAAFIATGANRVGEAVTSQGSTLVMKVISDKPIFSPKHGVYSQPLGEHWLVGGGSNSGGAVLLHYFDKETLEQMTPELRPQEPTGLDYYPLITAGERFPISDAQLQPRLIPRPENDIRFFQGMLEGMAEIELESYRLLQQLGAPYPSSIRSAGGGASNGAWTTIRQMKLNTTFIDAIHQEAAYGSALLAYQGLKTIQSRTNQ